MSYVLCFGVKVYSVPETLLKNRVDILWSVVP